MARTLQQDFIVTEATGFCAGHFPGHPIVPAAVQLQWLVALAQRHQLGLDGYEVKNLKLLQELPPGTSVRLELVETARGWQGTVRGEAGEIYARCRFDFHPPQAAAD